MGPWAASHSGGARAVISFTLPMGADGDSFKVHFQRGLKKTGAVSRFSAGAANHDFKIFTHRERNNNGRTFTVTKAYENKVSDLLSVSRIKSFATKGALAGVIAHPLNKHSYSNDVGDCADSGGGSCTSGSFVGTNKLRSQCGADQHADCAFTFT